MDRSLGSPRAGVALAVALLSSCAHTSAVAVNKSFALQRSDAVEVCMPPGEQLWLSRLRCPDGSPVRIVSRAAAGARNEPESADDPRQLQQLDPGRPLARGEPDFHIVESVVISCGDGDRTLFLDMYHCAQGPAQQAPAGLSIVPLELP